MNKEEGKKGNSKKSNETNKTFLKRLEHLEMIRELVQSKLLQKEAISYPMGTPKKKVPAGKCQRKGNDHDIAGASKSQK